jgi:tetratricopeptide (TPR) repeat protein
MTRSRWQHLDRSKPQPRPAASPTAVPDPQPPIQKPNALAEPASPIITQARAHYLLRDYDRCAELLLDSELPELPGKSRWLGLSSGQLGNFQRAAAELELAVREAPEDGDLQASLLSAQLRAGAVPEPPPSAPAGALGELCGAAAWVRGQALLTAGSAREAAASFDVAGGLFGRCSPASEAAERIGAAFVGAAVSRLVSGDLDAAQRSFSSLSSGIPAQRSARATRALVDFARQLYAAADAVRGLAPEERLEAVAPLVELVTTARLRVRFYDGRLPVSMHWDHLL